MKVVAIVRLTGVRARPAVASAVVLSVGGALVGGGAARGAGAVGGTTLVSVSSEGIHARDGSSGFPSISANGRYVVFTSFASNLVPDDTNGQPDVFVRDLATGSTRRMSVSSGEVQSNAANFNYYTRQAISSDGRFVVFQSDASDLVPDDTNQQTDVFLRDRARGTTRRMSEVSRRSEPDGYSYEPEISGDGAEVAFVSTASNLVPGDTNDSADVFVRNRVAGTVRVVSVDNDGVEGGAGADEPAISEHGGVVAFTSYSNLVHADRNRADDVYVREADGATRRVSVSSNETGGNKKSGFPTISRHGRYVAFQSSASNLVVGDTNARPDVFVRDLATGTTTRVSLATDGSQATSGGVLPAMSGDGRYVAFLSNSSNLETGDHNVHFHVYVRDRLRGVTNRVSIARTGVPTERGDAHCAISRDGRRIAFSSMATLLVPRDTNGLRDVFVRDTPQ